MGETTRGLRLAKGRKDIDSNHKEKRDEPHEPGISQRQLGFDAQ